MGNCKKLTKSLLRVLIALSLTFGSLTCAQGSEIQPGSSASSPQAVQGFSQQELDQMLAPIALYPDPLLSQILMASTYPLEVVEAARWTRAHPEQTGDEAVRSVQQRDWDPSVKSLVAFPRILQTLDEHLEWTENLGEAFLSDQSRAMETVQKLRQKAYAAGNLQSNDRIRVETEGQIIIVEPANPDIVYVPYYDPTVIYGIWWWSDYPPFYWAPWPGYVVRSGYAWGAGTVVITGFFFGDCDWHAYRVRIVNVNNYYYPRLVPDRDDAMRRVPPTPGFWRHDPEHRRGAQYHAVQLRNEYGQTGSAATPVRRSSGVQQSPAVLSIPESRHGGATSAGSGAGAVVPPPETRIRSERHDHQDEHEGERPVARSPRNSGGTSENASIPATRQSQPVNPEPSSARSVKPAEHEEHEHESRGREAGVKDARPHEEESPAIIRNRGAGAEQRRDDR